MRRMIECLLIARTKFITFYRRNVTLPPGQMPNIYNTLIIKGQDIVSKQINKTCTTIIGKRGIAMSGNGRCLNQQGKSVHGKIFCDA